MKLIGSLASPYVRKVRVVLAEKMLPYEFELENVWLADTSIGEHNPCARFRCCCSRRVKRSTIRVSSVTTWTR